MLLGTAAYMSPEQARGHPADRQSDIWAFGCVVYELLTGRRLFNGATVTDTLAAVLTGEPDWARVPPRARRLLRRCLERDPKQRLHDISDARFLLDEQSTDTEPVRWRPWPWLVAALSVVVLGVALWSPRSSAPVERELMRLALDLDPGAAPYALADAAISADGTRIAFYTREGDGRPLLATRRFDESRVTMLAGTEGADQPFFSPDGRWIGFFAGARLMKIPIQGGTPIALSDARVARGASWGEDGAIIAALSNRVGLSRVPADGGEPQSLTTVSEGDPTHRWPQVLPGGRAVLFTANTPTINSYEDATIDVQPLPAGQRKTVWRGGYFGRYVPTSGSRGHLVYIRHGVLFAAPFDLDRLEVDGPTSAIIEDVAADPASGAGFFDFSRNGTFIYRSGVGLRPWIVTWLDATGQTAPLLAKPGRYYSPRFSPDGQRLAVGIDDGKGMDTYVADLQRDTMSRLTFAAGTNWDPVWAPDGKHLVIRSGAATGPSVWWARADGGAEPVRLLDVPVGDVAANSFSPDGRTWIYSGPGTRFDADLWTISLDLTDPDRPKPGNPVLFLDSPGEQTRPAISPDGRWVAYQSNETGTGEVYIRPFSAPVSGGPRWQVSTSGGGQPMWSRTAPELFFTTGNQIMVTDYTIAGESFIASKPRLWSPTTFLANTGFTGLDLAPDGKRFATLQQGEPAARESNPRVTLLLNFFEDIRRRAPTR
jgi:serine/threonine-protein kinase